MISFKKLMETVNAPRSNDEKNFIKKHTVEIIDYPEDNPKKVPTKKDTSRIADYKNGKDAAVYEDIDSIVNEALISEDSSNFLEVGKYKFSDGTEKNLSKEDVKIFQDIYDETDNKEDLVKDALKSKKNFEDLISLKKEV